METIAEHICKTRLEHVQTQADLGRILNVHKRTVRDWEKNRYDPQVRLMPEVLRYSGYEPPVGGDSLGNRLRTYRRALGLTQEGNSRTAGVTKEVLRAWEREERLPHSHDLQQVKEFAEEWKPGNRKRRLSKAMAFV